MKSPAIRNKKPEIQIETGNSGPFRRAEIEKGLWQIEQGLAVGDAERHAAQ
jgi:hypothetical protein